MLGREDVVIVDIRDPREIQREGRIPGSFPRRAACWNSGSTPKAPITSRSSPRTRPSSSTAPRGWRSLLATEVLQRMGLQARAQHEGGFAAWKEAGGPVEKVEPK